MWFLLRQAKIYTAQVSQHPISHSTSSKYTLHRRFKKYTNSYISHYKHLHRQVVTLYIKCYWTITFLALQPNCIPKRGKNSKIQAHLALICSFIPCSWWSKCLCCTSKHLPILQACHPSLTLWILLWQCVKFKCCNTLVMFSVFHPLKMMRERTQFTIKRKWNFTFHSANTDMQTAHPPT
jgi:hypothetical protein